MTGRKILLTAEQGLGDVIHFVRYARVLADQGAEVIVECPQGLQRIIATVPGVSRAVAWGEDAVADVALPLMSLPHLLGDQMRPMGEAVPYIDMPSDTATATLPAATFKVGVVWQGNPNHDNDRFRSLSLQRLAPLLDVTDVTWFSLQVGAGRDQLRQGAWGGRITDLAPSLTDFGATAAVMTQLDLVISVDTAAAHLAGALGREVWLLVPRGNDWRWFHDRSDSPWYPTMRLFRQAAPRDWTPAIAEMREALRARVGP